jgi:hypothetical protein
MRMLTLQLKRCSEMSIVTGDGRSFMDSGELYWKGNDNYPVLEDPPTRFLLPGGPRRRGGASRTHGRPSGELNRRREDLAGVRVSGL